jgi:hypothetical protein
LYAYGTSFTNDIKSGNIFCTGDDGTCCPQGYYAAPGWDPTTGFGSVNYGKMASVLTALGSTIVPTSSPVVAPTPVPVTAPIPAPVAAGSPLSGYFISASYLDSTCGALRHSTSKLLNACDRNFDSTSSYYTATSTEFITKSYTDSACKSNEKVTREAYTGLCSGSLKRYVSGAPDPPSTAPAVYYRLVHPIPSLLSLSHVPFLPLYIIYPSCLSLNYISPFLFLSRSLSLTPTNPSCLSLPFISPYLSHLFFLALSNSHPLFLPLSPLLFTPHRWYSKRLNTPDGLNCTKPSAFSVGSAIDTCIPEENWSVTILGTTLVKCNLCCTLSLVFSHPCSLSILSSHP